MIVPKFNNSAGRLLEILSHIDPGKPLQSYLPDLIFQAEPQWNGHKRIEMTIDAMSEIQRIYHQFKEDMETAPFNDEQREVFKKRLEKIEDIIYTPAANGAVRAITEGEKVGFEFCATTFEREAEFASSDIEAIWRDIHELQQQVEKGDIPPALKRMLLELIRLSQDALERYNIHGSRGIEKAFKGMLGEVIWLNRYSKEEKEKIKNSPAWKKVWKFFVTFESAFAKTMKYPPMIEHYFPGLLN